ncbi:hypothetical protein ILUMI_06609 [Ignelater luminosus]|uniref:Centromere/kinetochore protein zw10 homolog n=1 Tax=Ignelater luminosus TaxID=2038154 RepID=A0A8K0D5E5_IGNLU|nr:hypothetical protein ILUMI_06609 [Ignelater luminosus]
MNFLAEVLQSAEETDIESCKTKVPVITKQIENYKKEINGYINDVYHEFREWPKKNQHLLDNASQLSHEITNLQNRIEDITMKEVGNKINDLGNLSDELKCSSIALGIVVHLVRANELFLNFKELLSKKMYLKAANELILLDECIDSVPKDEVTKAIESLKINVLTERSQLVKVVSDIFEENIKISHTKSGVIQTNSIKIKNKTEEFVEALAVLNLCNKSATLLNDFSKFLYLNICKPIIAYVTTVKIEASDDYHSMTVAIKKSSTKIPYKDIFNKLLEVFKFLHSHLNYSLSKDTKIITVIGNEIKSDLSETIVKDCLSDTLPSSSPGGDSRSYKNIIEDIKAFQNALIEMEILSANSNPILDYANNMDILLINKKCHEYLTTAICYMKKDLHDLVDVGERKEPGSPLSIDEFPESSISRSTIEILQLAENILQQATFEPDLVAARLVCTVQSIFYQYGNIVCGHHERLLQSIPQQVALFRNNCMYIAYQLSQMNEVYSSKFTQAVLPSPPLFTDQAHHLKTIGGEVFLSYVEEQVQSMESTLQEYQFNSIQISQVLNPGTDKCIRQCIRQYEILKTVWHNILPLSVYNKTLGYLLNTFCKKLVDVVVGAEDIPFKNAEQLIEMFKVILTRGPKLFADPQDIYLFVESWQKLNDLVFILGARLVDIADRWAEGKGPLTLHFSADEVRNLIKALFQNTDRRAAVLNKIHN